jgi:uncharacterized membrane protein YgdD (TMEM256/DUF423 family)
MNWSAIAAVFLALAVSLGAFGAHGLRARLDANHLDIYKTAVQYHFLHALGLLIVSTMPKTGAITAEAANSVCWLLAAGILIFSGSLYVLAVTGIDKLGVITPFGGVAFIAGWVLLAWKLVRS